MAKRTFYFNLDNPYPFIREINDEFAHYDFTCWLTTNFEVYVDAKGVHKIGFGIKDGEVWWNIVYDDHYGYPVYGSPCLSVEDLIVKFFDIMADPQKYRT